MLMPIRRFEFLILLGIFTTVPGSANGVLAMRLTSFENEMLKAASQAANIPSPLPSLHFPLSSLFLPLCNYAERSEALRL